MRAEPESAPANALGVRRIMFMVDDVATRLRSHAGAASAQGHQGRRAGVEKAAKLTKTSFQRCDLRR